jgi:hypothetical protein
MPTNMRVSASVVVIAMSLATACGADDRSIADTAALGVTAESGEGVHDADTRTGVGGRKGTDTKDASGQSTRHMSAVLMDSMETQLRSLEGVSVAQMRTIVPVHRQRVARLLSELDSDMRAMNMSPDRAWRALTDSVRRDLDRMPEMEGSEMRVFMPDHHRRVDHLMTMHRRMMAGAKM